MAFFKLTVALLSLAALTAAAPTMEKVFRYSSESGDQEHHMSMNLESGVPSMEGGWKFMAGDGVERELTYKADEMGFQPEAEYLPVAPVAVEDTKEVQEAKVTFKSLYEKHAAEVKKAQLEATAEKKTEAESEESAVVSVERRSVDDMIAMEDVAAMEDLEDQMMVESRTADEVKPEMKYNMHPYYYATHGGYKYNFPVYNPQVTIPGIKYVTPAKAEKEEEETPYSVHEVKAETEVMPMKEEAQPLLKQFFHQMPVQHFRYPNYYYPMMVPQFVHQQQRIVAPVMTEQNEVEKEMMKPEEPAMPAEETAMPAEEIAMPAEETAMPVEEPVMQEPAMKEPAMKEPVMTVPATAPVMTTIPAGVQQQLVSFAPFYQPFRVIYPGQPLVHVPLVHPLMPVQAAQPAEETAALENGMVPNTPDAKENGALVL